MSKEKINFIVSAFDYTDQYGGIIVLHKLADELAGLGEKAYIVANKKRANNRAELISESEARQLAERTDSYVIYPEVISGNPLGFKNVVRFVLYKPGANGGDTVYDSKELVYGHTKYCVQGTPYEDAPLLGCIDPKLETFFDLKLPRSGVCTLIKKGRHKNIVNPSNVIDSYLGNPNIDQILQKIFNKFEHFLSYDSASYHIIQAALCGCTPIVIPDEGLTKSEWVNKQPIMKYGVAYGENDIQWAIDTRHLVKDHVLEFYKESLKTVENLRNDCYKHYANVYLSGK